MTFHWNSCLPWCSSWTCSSPRPMAWVVLRSIRW